MFQDIIQVAIVTVYSVGEWVKKRNEWIQFSPISPLYYPSYIYDYMKFYMVGSVRIRNVLRKCRRQPAPSGPVLYTGISADFIRVM